MNNDRLRNLIHEWKGWARLGWYDILSRYRRTKIGPLWITLTTLISVCAIGLVYSVIFRITIKDFLPFVAIGIIIWTWISTTLMESCSAFINYKFILLNHQIHPSSILIRIVLSNFFIFFHNCLVILILFVFLKHPLSWNLLLVIPNLILLEAILFSLSVIFAFICSRFPDLAQLIASTVGLLFMVTPVIWMPEILGERYYIAYLNPITHMIALVRQPILGFQPELINWVVAFGILILCASLAWITIRAYCARVRFWI